MLALLTFSFVGYLLGAAQPAWAHAELIGSTPANGSRLAEAPAEIRLRFSEKVNAVRDGVTLLDSAGAVQLVGTPSPGSESVLAITKPLPDGVYTVVWRVVSADSHPIHGAFVFSVGDAVVAALPGGAQSDVDPGLAAVFWLARWLGYAGLALLAGGVCFLIVCWPSGWASARVRRVIAAGWLTSVMCAGAALVLQGPYSQGGTLAGVADPALAAATLRSGYGAFMLARLGLLVAGGLLALALTRQRPMWIKVCTVVLLGVALPATWAGTGHAAAGNPLTKAVDTLHLSAMSIWLGGLAVLLTALLTRSAPPSAQAATALTRFSPLAAGCVATLVLTGIYQAWRGVGSIDALAGSAYGRLLLYKVAGIGVLLWLGALSNSAVRRGYANAATSLRGRAAREAAQQEQRSRAGLRRSVGLETVTAVAVLALTSVLVSTPPGSRPTTAPIAASTATEATLSLPGGARVSVTLDPARVGVSRLALSVRDKAGTDWDVPEVSASLSLPARSIGPLPVALSRLQAGRYQSQSLSLPAPGGWRLRISVRVSDFDQHTVETEVTVK
ncbi:copper resistance CopC/CopD family protein [Rhizocola hellebori]|uniref:copper resistance CopC/CopD family protein n=1 Tax=Rhizocola hellebori TaxID=1392758 RepID=UPI0019437813|nr:copper resistance protein CopC [Rhizocola hellebori]